MSEVYSIFDHSKKRYRFGLVPKQLSSPFFAVVNTGCHDRASKVGNVECVYVGTSYPDVLGQAQIIRDLASPSSSINNSTGTPVDGIALALADSSPVTNRAIAYARGRGIPVITFDSDAEDSQRLTYIGTDNYKLGSALGKVLIQIDPTEDTTVLFRPRHQML